jgi:hypothetical protein
MSESVTHRGACHCGRVRIEVDAPTRIEAIECNCSICNMTGFLHLIVPASRFRLLQGAESLTEYTFNTGVAKHRFCKVCGIKVFYIPRSHPDGIDVNVRCLDPATIQSVSISQFDDSNRESETAAIAYLAEEGASP